MWSMPMLWTPSRDPSAFELQIIEKLKPKLNTQRIEYFFGSVGVEVLDIESSGRIIRK
ncbi:hypothetical protein [Simkania sp.]|uniref:hypothetical protein n=1 Tax=Simkania sp. TaxID=34094 RepID=UPI003B5272CB